MSSSIEPGWRPEYTGDNSLGWVGSGQRLGVHLYYLYRAGRNELPWVAATYANLTAQLHQVTADIEALFDLPGRGIGTAHRRLLELRDETHDVLRQTSIRMREIGAALVQTADEYAATDAAAAAEFSRLLDEHADDYRTPPRPVPEPPGVHDPQPPRVHIGGHHPSDRTAV